MNGIDSLDIRTVLLYRGVFGKIMVKSNTKGNRMKIGAFAEKNRISKDTIRHYMDLGLIIPEKQGAQYAFNKSCQKCLEDVLYLKELSFTLSDIKEIFMFRFLGNLTHYQQDAYYQQLFIKRYEDILNNIENLSATGEKLKEKIDNLSLQKYEKKFTIGINIKCLDILKCLKCSGQLTIQGGTIEDHQIINGKLKCDCGEVYSVSNGILMGKSDFDEQESNINEHYISTYINATDSNYLDTLYKGIDWMKKQIDFNDFSQKVILEVGSGVGFFLRNILEQLPDDALYIAVDHDIARHNFLKNMIEMSNIKKNIMFICTDFLEIPIREQSADILMDLTGTSNYSFEHSDCLLELVNHYVKDKAYLISNYIIFKKFSGHSLIEDQYKKNFVVENIKAVIKALDYTIIDERLSEYLEKGGKYENYFIEGEKVCIYACIGKRLG